MTKIYEQHTAAFAQVSSYAVLKNGEPVATVAFKFPRDGAGRLYAYVHWIGLEMVRGFAGGYGYDKRTAACAHAVACAIKDKVGAETPDQARHDIDGKMHARTQFFTALARDAGQHWDSALRDAGFTVFQTI